ncbi:hypothetical protein JTB14_017009 [Gonioctena quinquepunctata]|nr:hypothetical protein JTB14_017009 [Gonioctena quinquepunctata]
MCVKTLQHSHSLVISENYPYSLQSHTIPWEEDGILYWPTKCYKDSEKLIRDPESVPRIDWEKYLAVLRRQTLNKLCSLFCTLADTDAEIEI